VSDDALRNVPSLTYSGARRVLGAAVAACESRGWAFCIAVVDAAGHPLASARMDGAPLLSVGIAANKAYSVTAFNGMPTAAWWPMIGENPALAEGLPHTPNLVVFGGGVPVTVDGAVVGAVGVSGGSAEQDAEIAAEAAAALTP
jgi:uncharacterized protein GlcG (DUF336 family)